MMYMDKSSYYEKKRHDRRSYTYIDTEESLKKVETVAELLPGGFLYIMQMKRSKSLLLTGSYYGFLSAKIKRNL